jgi:hypothetical protein
LRDEWRWIGLLRLGEVDWQIAWESAPNQTNLIRRRTGAQQGGAEHCWKGGGYEHLGNPVLGDVLGSGAEVDFVATADGLAVSGAEVVEEADQEVPTMVTTAGLVTAGREPARRSVAAVEEEEGGDENESEIVLSSSRLHRKKARRATKLLSLPPKGTEAQHAAAPAASAKPRVNPPGRQRVVR